MLNLACVPAYALSVLWHRPSLLFNLAGGVGAALQVAAAYFLWLDAKRTKLTTLLSFSLLAFTLKVLLQATGAIPALAVTAYEVRNVVIAYLHLVLLGFISVAVFTEVLKGLKRQRLFRCGVALFLFSFLTTEGLLLLQAAFAARLLTVAVPCASQLLVLFSLPFAAGALLMAVAVRRGYQGHVAYKSFLLKERRASHKGKAIQSSSIPKV